MPQDLPIKAAHAVALARWETPFPGFASGHDPRTSDNALLTLLYGGLVHAADHDWLNAGRRLIDKTYIDMLWHVQDLTNMRAIRPEQIAAALADGPSPGETWSNGAPAETRVALEQAFRADEDWGPAAVVDVVQGRLPKDAIVTVDTGAHRILLSQIWRCARPHTLLAPTRLWNTPAAAWNCRSQCISCCTSPAAC